MSQIRIIIADDHTMFRQGLRTMINDETDMVVVGQARDGFQVQAKVRDLNPDIVLMDVKMPRLDGAKAVRLISEQHPEVRIIMLTMYDQDKYLFESITAGARGYILKDAPVERLIEMIRAVYHGKEGLDPYVTSKVFRQFRDLAEGQHRRDIPLLTQRDVEIIHLIAKGATNKDIAEELFLSENTIKHIVSEILRKLNVRNRAEAAAYAVREGLITLDSGG